MTKRLLIVGGGGMLGHKLAQVASARFETTVTLRGDRDRYGRFYALLPGVKIHDGVDVHDPSALRQVLINTRPDAVVNCVGIVKQLREAHDPIVSISTNSLFPHRLAQLCDEVGARVVHVSTDCVFSGRAGHYDESQLPDPPDLYGRSKLLGEIDAPHLTLRTSIIGRELAAPTTGLVEWFLAQTGIARGYRRAIFSGLPTVVLSELICDLIEKDFPGSGLFHVSAAPINKYDLLLLLREAYGRKIEIEPHDDLVIDRSLDSSRFRTRSGFEPPQWPQLIERMAADPTPYDQWRSS